MSSSEREQIAALEQRVTELEQRMAEAGRRLIFRSRSSVAGARVVFETVGRALLFEDETPSAG